MRLLVVLLACSSLISTVAIAVAVVAGVSAWRDDDDEPAPRIGRALEVDDLCAAVEPLVPRDLDLGEGSSSTDTVDGRQRATCTVGSPGRAWLEVRVTGYALPEGDPQQTLDQLLGTACDALELHFPVRFDRNDAGCHGQDTEATLRPRITTASRVSALPHLDALVSVALTQRDHPVRNAVYVSAISYGLLGTDLAG